MPRFRVTYELVDSLTIEVECNEEEPSIGDLIAAAYSSPDVILPSVEAEITDALWWDRVDGR